LLQNKHSGSADNSYWDIEVPGQHSGSGFGTGKTTEEMQDNSSYLDWDIELTEESIYRDGNDYRYPSKAFLTFYGKTIRM